PPPRPGRSSESPGHSRLAAGNDLPGNRWSRVEASGHEAHGGPKADRRRCADEVKAGQRGLESGTEHRVSVDHLDPIEQAGREKLVLANVDLVAGGGQQ